MAAGKHPRDIERAIDADPMFAEEVPIAVEYFRDALEHDHLIQGRRGRSPVPTLFRLKAERPSRYNEKAQGLLTVNLLTVDGAGNAADVADFMRSMLAGGKITDATRAELAAMQNRSDTLTGIIDGTATRVPDELPKP